MENIPSQPWIDLPATYQIIVKGRLDVHWTEWFDDLTITVGKNESGIVITTMTGLIQDQGALHGLLARVRDSRRAAPRSSSGRSQSGYWCDC